jgi:hypothetical protein
MFRPPYLQWNSASTVLLLLCFQGRAFTRPRIDYCLTTASLRFDIWVIIASRLRSYASFESYM